MIDSLPVGVFETGDDLGVDLEEDVDGVPCPLGALCREYSGGKPGGDARVSGS